MDVVCPRCFQFLASSIVRHCDDGQLLLPLDGHYFTWWELYWDLRDDPEGSGPFLKVEFDFRPGWSRVYRSYVSADHALELLSSVGSRYARWLSRYGCLYEWAAIDRHMKRCLLCSPHRQWQFPEMWRLSYCDEPESIRDEIVRSRRAARIQRQKSLVSP